MSTAATIGRNSACPCGSGTKAKRCHPERVGERPESLAARRVREWAEGVLADVASMPGYVPPADGVDGWSRESFRASGCPYGPGCCGGRADTLGGSGDGEAWQLGGCAAGCGV